MIKLIISVLVIIILARVACAEKKEKAIELPKGQVEQMVKHGNKTLTAVSKIAVDTKVNGTPIKEHADAIGKDLLNKSKIAGKTIWNLTKLAGSKVIDAAGPEVQAAIADAKK
jgi:hypothetical protein